MPVTITAVRAHPILDSRGRPTLAVAVAVPGSRGEASVPSGASTGTHEAVELRDHDPARWHGAGVDAAVAAVNGEIADLLCGRRWESQAEIDAAMIDLDGTSNKRRLGANAIVGVSLATARALASHDGSELYSSLRPDGVQLRLPVPHFNVLNGGAHAPNPLQFQEFMVAPLGAPMVGEAIRCGAEIYHELRNLLTARGLATAVGDEGGFAPDIDRPEQACELLVEAIVAAGYDPGFGGVALALDPAANGFATGRGRYEICGDTLTSAQLIDRYAEMAERYPIWSIEDGLAEDDPAWPELTRRLGEQLQIVGDDLLVTNPATIEAAVRDRSAAAALIKPNQVGTVSETLEALAVCRRAGWGAMISHRSGDTPDDFVADLAVGSGCGQLKSGAPARGERIAKYNRLLAIDSQLPNAPYGVPAEQRR